MLADSLTILTLTATRTDLRGQNCDFRAVFVFILVTKMEKLRRREGDTWAKTTAYQTLRGTKSAKPAETELAVFNVITQFCSSYCIVIQVLNF